MTKEQTDDLDLRAGTCANEIRLLFTQHFKILMLQALSLAATNVRIENERKASLTQCTKAESFLPVNGNTSGPL